MTWTIAEDNRHLQRDGQDDFVLADTLWAGLHRADTEGLVEVFDTRAAQGFNAVMFSLLPIAHDRSGEVRTPFVDGRDGLPDFDRLDQEWLRRAQQTVQLATDRGLTPVLMLQWVNYVPQSWGSLAAPGYVMSDEQTAAYLAAVVPAFAPFDPIWSLSGDDTFTSDASVERYLAMVAQLRELDPDHLVTAHTGGYNNFPDRLLAEVDFVGFQSGHDGANWADAPAGWNRYLDQRSHRTPRMNLEPPYEGHGYNSSEGRYLAREVRIASWRSVLTGAGAGLGYGAHGLWSWHQRGEAFSSEDWSSMPFDARTALRFPGARDMGWLRELAITHQLWRLDDRADLVVRDHSGIRVGGSANLDLLAVHAPHPFSFEVQVPAEKYQVQGYDLVTRQEVPVARSVGGSGMVVIDTPDELSEHLYILRAVDGAGDGAGA